MLDSAAGATLICRRLLRRVHPGWRHGGDVEISRIGALVARGAALAAACLVVVAPRVAGAALSLGNQPELSCAPGEHYFDLVFTETAPAEAEGLFAYGLALSYVPVGGGTDNGGFAFTGAQAPPDHFVLDVPGGAT